MFLDIHIWKNVMIKAAISQSLSILYMTLKKGGSFVEEISMYLNIRPESLYWIRDSAVDPVETYSILWVSRLRKVIHHFSYCLMTQSHTQHQVALRIFQLVTMAKGQDGLKTKKREMMKYVHTKLYLLSY